MTFPHAILRRVRHGIKRRVVLGLEALGILNEPEYASSEPVPSETAPTQTAPTPDRTHPDRTHPDRTRS